MLVLKNMYAYRFFDKKKGPLDTIRKYTQEEIAKIGRDAGITNIQDIYHNRVNMENLMYSLFKRGGGDPHIVYPYYFAVYDELPSCNKLHVRFQNPVCLKIPMSVFPKKWVSFTYGLSTHAFTRKDNHPCRRKLLSWDDAEKVINEIPFDENEDIWLEMQVWDESIIRDYYQKSNKELFPVQVDERLSEQEKDDIKKKYEVYSCLIRPEQYDEPKGVHGVSHTLRVLILAQELAEINHLDDYYKAILIYSAAYHDIGREHNFSDDKHGCKSYQKVIKFHLLPESLNFEQQRVLRFIIENHPFGVDAAKNNLYKYRINNQEMALKTFCVFRDADILDRSRYGNVNKHYLHFKSSRYMVPFAFQLLQIFKETF